MTLPWPPSAWRETHAPFEINYDYADRMPHMETTFHLERAAAVHDAQITKRLLLCGAIAGPLFVLSVLFQDYTRSGFDPRRDMLSLLSLGRSGWMQVANFIVAGALNVLYAVGLRRHLRAVRGGRASVAFICIFGLGLIVVGVFRTDPSNSFPPGSPPIAGHTVHGIIHALGALPTFLCLAAGIAALGRSFAARNEKGWAYYSFASAAALILVFFGSFPNADYAPRLLRLAVLVGWSAPSLAAIGLLSGFKRLS